MANRRSLRPVWKVGAGIVLAGFALVLLKNGGEAGRFVSQSGEAANLLDRTKLLAAELDTSHPPLLAHVDGEKRVDLGTLLHSGEDKNQIVWRIDGKEVDGGLYRWESGPTRDHTAAVHIVLSRKSKPELADEFVLVIVPAETASAFARWYETESAQTGWLAGLPHPYARLAANFSDPEPGSCGHQYWRGVRKTQSNYHPGARFEMRSEPLPDGTGHQATYDSNGVLITHGLAAGSADRGSPSWWPTAFRRHIDLDVKPFVWAAQLDGNPVNPKLWFTDLDRPPVHIGPHLTQYFRLRPPTVPGQGPPLEPGGCGP